jgi:hypothetical protein
MYLENNKFGDDNLTLVINGYGYNKKGVIEHVTSSLY